MRSTTLRISRGCNQACAFCEVKATLDGRPVPAPSIKAALDAAAQRGVKRVVFSGGEPTLSGQLHSALSYAKGLGLRTALATNGRLIGDLERAGRLYAAGVDEVLLALHSADPQEHNRIVGGDPLSFTQATAALELARARAAVTIRAVLSRMNLHALPGLVDLAARAGAALELRRVRRRGAAHEGWEALAITEEEAIGALESALRLAAKAQVPVRFYAFDGGPPCAPAAEDRAVDLIDARLFDAGVLTPAMRAGLLPPPEALRDALAAARKVDADTLGQIWASQGAPWRTDAPRAGAAARRPAAGPIAVVAAPPGDPWPTLSTLPGLVHHLKALGADVTWCSPYDATFDPARVAAPAQESGLARLGAGLRSWVRGPAAPLAHPERVAPTDPATTAAWRRFLAELDLSRAAVVVTADAATAEALRTAGLRARVYVLEEALLDGLPAPLTGDDVLRSPFMYYLNLYHASGVSPHHLHHAPVPTFTGHVAGGAAAERCEELLVIGGDDADPALTPAGAAILPHRAPPEGWSQVIQRLQRARAVVLPWRADRPPTSLRFVSLALAAGRPVIAPALPALRSTLRHGVDALLTPLGDAASFAEAVERLRDDALVARLAAGARERAAIVDTAQWAADLVNGAR